jgi:hypothetical protein
MNASMNSSSSFIANYCSDKEESIMCKETSYIVSTAVIMTFAAMILFPLMGVTGSLDPSTIPAPTMKTLDEIPPTWSQALPDAQRFELVLEDAAVLDKQTGLVWERTPNTAKYDWKGAISHCTQLEVGHRKGWHLPTIEQLMSLGSADLFNVAFPYGDGRVNLWSVTTNFYAPQSAWALGGSMFAPAVLVDKTSDIVVHPSGGGVDCYYAWCVRDGQSLPNPGLIFEGLAPLGN